MSELPVQLLVLFGACAAGGLSPFLLSSASVPLKRWGLGLLCFAVSASAAVLLLPEGGESGRWYGMPAERVAKIRGIVKEDLKPGRGSRESVVVDLREVESAGGTRTGAAGALLIFTESQKGGKDTLLRRGAEVYGPVHIEPSHTEGERAGYGYADGRLEIRGWRSPLEKLRARGLAYVHTRIRSAGHRSSGLLSALLLGVRGPESVGTFELFRRAGAVHLLALSGMHLGFLFLIFAGIFMPLLGKRPGLVLTLAAIVFYLLFVGPRPSLVRAVLMSGAGILWTLVSVRKIDPFRLLVCAFILQSAFMTESAYTLSFGLSYLALFGILGFSRGVERRLPWILPPGVRTVCAAGISAQAFSAPLLLSMFGEVYPVGVVSSVVLTPMVLLLMGGGIAYLLWSAGGVFFPGELYILADRTFRNILSAAVWAIEETAAYLSRAPSLRFPGDEGRGAALLWIVLLTLIVLLHYGGIILAIDRRKNAETEESRFTRRITPVSGRGGAGTVAPIWSELPHKPEGSEQNRKIA
ncbi:MAG: ComEC/Rec2 family competence protein [Spirochaetaceae bacterium]